LPQVKAPVVQDGTGYWLGSFQPPGSSEQKTFVTDYYCVYYLSFKTVVTINRN
jgi:hypothetical protein